MAGVFKRFTDLLLNKPSGGVSYDSDYSVVADEGVDTFVEATGGGWSDTPEVVPADGGEHRDYVAEQLKRAREQAIAKELKVGDTLEYRITNIPKGIGGPHAISFGMMMQTKQYGFTPLSMRDETISLSVDREFDQ